MKETAIILKTNWEGEAIGEWKSREVLKYFQPIYYHLLGLYVARNLLFPIPEIFWLRKTNLVKDS